jgi:hypothetical protein
LRGAKECQGGVANFADRVPETVSSLNGCYSGLQIAVAERPHAFDAVLEAINLDNAA